MDCLLDDHDTKELQRKMAKPDVEHRVSGQPAQSASMYAVMDCASEPNKCRQKAEVPLTYRKTHFSIVR